MLGCDEIGWAVSVIKLPRALSPHCARAVRPQLCRLVGGSCPQRGAWLRDRLRFVRDKAETYGSALLNMSAVARAAPAAELYSISEADRAESLQGADLVWVKEHWKVPAGRHVGAPP